MGVVLTRDLPSVQTLHDNAGRYLWSSHRHSKVEGLSARNLTNLSDDKCVREWLVRGVTGFESPMELNISIPVFRQALSRTTFYPRRLPPLVASCRTLCAGI